MTYHPDPDALPLLGNIPAKLASATPIDDHFERRPRLLAKLATGEVYMDSEMQLDTDGWPGGANGDGTHQSGTSWNYSGGGDRPIDANAVPYFVLPKGGWQNRFDISLGDYAAVIYKTRLAHAVFADRGQPNRIGEGSIQLLRELGFERIKHDGSVQNVGTSPGVITIIFPGSGKHKTFPDQAAVLAALHANARQYFEKLRDTPPSAPIVG